MSKKHTLAGFIIGLAISSGILLLLLPGLFERASSGHIWLTWLFFGLAISCAAGTLLTRRSAQ
ncbi:hypothetical protein AB0Y14_11155 [Rothia sp. HC945]|uniref:hypothetical protein n=1 Tax=Micrococcaceae TaxID=1268 RepID=UPI0010126E4B|nr:hypothetical protein [Kocuria sp. 257]